MYYNDVHILIYVLFGIIGVLVGKLVDFMNHRFAQEKSIFSLEAIEDYKLNAKKSIIPIVITPIIYIILLYVFGLKEDIISNINLLKYLILSPMLLSVFAIDWKLQIIPNRLNLTMFEIGLAFAFILGIININIGKDMLLGMFVGAGSFLIITLLGGLIAGKEAMGFGDVKLMGALGLYFGVVNTVLISLMSFLIGAIFSIILIVSKIKKTSDYIPFGPFIVMATFIMMFVHSNVIIRTLTTIFTLGLNR